MYGLSRLQCEVYVIAIILNGDKADLNNEEIFYSRISCFRYAKVTSADIERSSQFTTLFCQIKNVIIILKT
jgi:hypothetical protein